MPKYSVVRYTDKYFDRWNTFVDESNNGTLFHRLDFLEYHGEKYLENEHHLLILKGESIFAVLPLAVFSGIAKSPFASSFGGIVFKRTLSLSEAVTIVETLVDYFEGCGWDECILQSAPYCYHKQQNSYIDFALLKNGFQLEVSEIFNVIDLPDSYEELWFDIYQGRCRTTLRKTKEQFEIDTNASLDEFYMILMEDKVRHGNSRPTHTQGELKILKETFPEKVYFEIAYHKETMARAGVCYFQPSKDCVLTFYMSQENKALKLDGINYLIDHAIRRSITNGIKYFDFGASTIGLEVENYGVSKFKESFGAKGFSRSLFKWKNV